MEIRSQKMAQAAYPLVARLQRSNLESKYRTLALTFPTMILQSGLSQAVGFLMAKDKEEHAELLNHLSELLGYKRHDNNSEASLKKNREAFHSAILKADFSQYQLLTRKALDASSWLKRYTQALLKKEGE